MFKNQLYFRRQCFLAELSGGIATDRRILVLNRLSPWLNFCKFFALKKNHGLFPPSLTFKLAKEGSLCIQYGWTGGTITSECVSIVSSYT